jgi:acetyl-CoA C-acetyltransferase
MAVDPRTPVLVGAGTATQRLDDPAAALEACALIAAACDAAALDAGAPGLLSRADMVVVPQGTWAYADAGRLVADSIGASGARTVVGEFGVLQTTLIERAATAIQAGACDVALVVGGEAKWRDLRTSITGVQGPTTVQTDATPDEVLAPAGALISPLEIEARLVSAVSQYALLEHARRRADGETPAAHAAEVAGLWERFNQVARGNPAAWHRQPMSAAEIATPGPRNRPLATPYLKWHNSQWNVDQAACLILCSAEAAMAAGVASDRWLFPHAMAHSDHMVPVSARPALHRSPGFRLAGQAALAAAGIGVDDVAHVDLYSCFPIAVRTQALELGLGTDRPLTVTGGMTFAGGPLNNYVLQSTAAMTARLRADPGAVGMVTAISAMITKQGVTLWSSQPPAHGMRAVDVSAAVAAESPPVAVGPGTAGPAPIESYTVLHDAGGAPERAVVIVRAADGTRSIATSVADAAAMTVGEWGGRTVELDGAAGFSG